MGRRLDGKGSTSSRSALSATAAAVGAMLRDLGSVRFCRRCRAAELPGTEVCRRCGVLLVDACCLQPPKQRALENRDRHGGSQPRAEDVEPPRPEVKGTQADDAEAEAEPPT